MATNGGVFGGVVSVRLIDAVSQLLGELATVFGKPEPTASVVQLYAEALVEPRAPGKPARAPRLDAIPFAGLLLRREAKFFPPPAVVVDAVVRATRQLYDQERETDGNHARQPRRATGDHQGCLVCGAQYVEHPNGRVYLTHDAQRHGWSDA